MTEKNEGNTNAALSLLEDLDGGYFVEMLAKSVRAVVSGIGSTSKAGKISIELDIKPGKLSNQSGGGIRVDVYSKISFARPTMNGKASEVNTTMTQMWVNDDDTLTIKLKNQDELFSSLNVSHIAANKGK